MSAPAPPASVLDAVEHEDEVRELRSAWSGDERAFTALYRRHRAAVYRFAWLLTGSAAQAADITQDVFVELLSAPKGYDAARGSLAAYLCGIARFRAYRAIDSRMQSVDDFDALVEAHAAHDAPAMPYERLERARALQTLYGAIRKLPPIFRDVLILVELQEMSYSDTAAIAGIELGTVRSRLSRAKLKLAQLLNEKSE
ncbi:MAG: RNA polymerase sigma factor [Burkholderiaceae bacterium]|nr:RNA polymerase sigma factor [Burkholderiaceae bacterium]